MTSVQGNDLTQMGHVAFRLIHLDELNSWVPFPNLFLALIKSSWPNMDGDLVASHDLN